MGVRLREWVREKNENRQSMCMWIVLVPFLVEIHWIVFFWYVLSSRCSIVAIQSNFFSAWRDFFSSHPSPWRLWPDQSVCVCVSSNPFILYCIVSMIESNAKLPRCMAQQHTAWHERGVADGKIKRAEHIPLHNSHDLLILHFGTSAALCK